MKQKRKFGLLLAVLIVGDVAAMIAGLAFCFKALGIPVHMGVLITGFNFGITLTVISFIPGDLGVQEASIAGILAISVCHLAREYWDLCFSGWFTTSYLSSSAWVFIGAC